MLKTDYTSELEAVGAKFTVLKTIHENINNRDETKIRAELSKLRQFYTDKYTQFTEESENVSNEYADIKTILWHLVKSFENQVAYFTSYISAMSNHKNALDSKSEVDKYYVYIESQNNTIETLLQRLGQLVSAKSKAPAVQKQNRAA